MATILSRAGKPPTNTFPAMFGKSSGRPAARRSATRRFSSTWKRWKKRSRKTWTLRRSRCGWVRRGLTRAISSNSWRKPSIRPDTCAAPSRSSMSPTPPNGRLRTRPAYPTATWPPTPLTAPTGPMPIGFWRIP
ncbi:hypothetical protein SDC9_79986 [bioreactor metagenome]|uniref:Uncharacterized protein n=1 Tax=bioreactor metagenome TaxID=1076179 RepID=A0A644Z083_9ZZZZ